VSIRRAHGREKKKADRVAKRRRVRLWLVGAALLLAGGVATYVYSRGGAEPPGPDAWVLTGRWLRPDGGYVLALSGPTSGGALNASYSNPRPINVSRATWEQQDGALRVFVELHDAGYPGSTYAPDADRLAGVYFQAVLQKQFAVEFIRAE
jgi:hypothetical protein